VTARQTKLQHKDR